MASKPIHLNMKDEDFNYDTYAQQLGAKDWNDLVEIHKKDPSYFTRNKGKLTPTNPDKYTFEDVANRLEWDLGARSDTKSAVPSLTEADIKQGAEFIPGPMDAVETETIEEEDPLQSAIERIRKGEASDDDLKLAFEGGYQGGEKTQAEYERLGLLGNEDSSFEVMQKAEELAEPEKGDTAKEKEAKKRYRKATMSIWDAYNAGEIDKATAGYFTIDAIATLSKNLGRGVGNVGAQFTGGAIDQGHDTSDWERRRNELMGEEIQMEKESLGGPSARQAQSELIALESQKEGVTSQQLQNAKNTIQNEYTRTQIEQEIAAMQKQLEMAGINVEMASSRKAAIDKIKEDPNWASNPLKVYAVSLLAESGATGVTNTTKGVLDSVIDLVK